MSKIQLTSSGGVAGGVMTEEQNFSPLIAVDVSTGPQWDVPKEKAAVSLEGYSRVFLSKGFGRSEIGGRFLLHNYFGTLVVSAGPHVGARFLPGSFSRPSLVLGGEFSLGGLFPDRQMGLEFYFSADAEEHFIQDKGPTPLCLLGGFRFNNHGH